MRRSSGVFLTLPARLRLASAGTSARAVAHALGLRLLRPLWRRHDRVVQSHGLPAGVGAARRKSKRISTWRTSKTTQFHATRHWDGPPWGNTEPVLEIHMDASTNNAWQTTTVGVPRKDSTPASWPPRRTGRTSLPRRGPQGAHEGHPPLPHRGPQGAGLVSKGPQRHHITD